MNKAEGLIDQIKSKKFELSCDIGACDIGACAPGRVGGRGLEVMTEVSIIYHRLTNRLVIYK